MRNPPCFLGIHPRRLPHNSLPLAAFPASHHRTDFRKRTEQVEGIEWPRGSPITCLFRPCTCWLQWLLFTHFQSAEKIVITCDSEHVVGFHLPKKKKTWFTLAVFSHQTFQNLEIKNLPHQVSTFIYYKYQFIKFRFKIDNQSGLFVNSQAIGDIIALFVNNDGFREVSDVLLQPVIPRTIVVIR